MEDKQRTYLINPLLDDQFALARRHKLIEYFLEVLRHLLERPLDRLILPLIKHFDQLLDGFSRLLEVLSSFKQLVALLCEVRVLLESFLVDVSKFLEGFVDSMKFLDELCARPD